MIRPPPATVAIIYRYVPQYREEFFRLLRTNLADRGVELALYYGTPSPAESKKGDAKDIEWGHKHRNFYIPLGSKRALWQPVLLATADADLVIVEQISKLLVNYPLWLRSQLGLQRLAIWGHGKDMQTPYPNSFSERTKAWFSRRVDWWFAYNDLSVQIVRGLGYPAGRITSVQNTVNTTQLTRCAQTITEQDLNAQKTKLGIEGDNIGLYAGGMYGEKRLPFLLEACQMLRQRIPDFHMIFIGSGISSNLVADFAAANNWVHYLGPVFDLQKVPYFKMAKVFLMPGLVGLALLDCFALEAPLVTTAMPYHSPEISYLENSVNGVIVSPPDDVGAYVDAVTNLLSNEDARRKLCLNGLAASRHYTIERMVQNFSDGIMDALRASKHHA